MRIQLVWDVPRINGASKLRSGKRFDILESEQIGLSVDGKPGFCSILVDGEPFTVWGLEFIKARPFSVWFLTVLILLAIAIQM